MKTKILQFIAATALVLSTLAGTASAANPASFSLSPASGSHVNGSTFTVGVYQNGDDVNVVTAKLVFDQAKLNCVSVAPTAAMPNDLGSACGNGSAKVSRYTNGGETVSGNVKIANVTFRAVAQGTTAAVSFDASSKIVSNGANIWNGDPTGGSYTLTAPAVEPGKGSGPTPAPTSPTPDTTPKIAATSTVAPQPDVASSTDSNPEAAQQTEATPATDEQQTAETQSIAEDTNQQTTNMWWVVALLMALAASIVAALYRFGKVKTAPVAQKAETTAPAKTAVRKKATPAKKRTTTRK